MIYGNISPDNISLNPTETALRLKTDNNKIKEFYIKKMQQSNPMCSKAAKIACVNKLVRIIHNMCKNGTLYQ